jgi:nitrogen fixation protein FixH
MTATANPTSTKPSAIAAAVQKKAKRRYLLWPILLTSLIGIHTISVIVMVIVATHDSSFALEPDWYLKGLHYEQTVEQQQANSRLKWSVQLDVGQPLDGSHRRKVTCTIRDAAGKPIENATVDLVAFAHLRANNRQSSVLLPQEGGSYAATLPFEDVGMWEFRVVVTRGADTFTHIVKREI